MFGGTIGASWTANAAATAVFMVAGSRGAAAVPPATLICITVRVLGPKPGMVVGAPPWEVMSGPPV